MDTHNEVGRAQVSAAPRHTRFDQHFKQLEEQYQMIRDAEANARRAADYLIGEPRDTCNEGPSGALGESDYGSAMGTLDYLIHRNYAALNNLLTEQRRLEEAEVVR